MAGIRWNSTTYRAMLGVAASVNTSNCETSSARIGWNGTAALSTAGHKLSVLVVPGHHGHHQAATPRVAPARGPTAATSPRFPAWSRNACLRCPRGRLRPGPFVVRCRGPDDHKRHDRTRCHRAVARCIAPLSDHDALNLVDRNGVRRPVVELRRLRRRVPGDLLGVLEGPPV